MATDKLIIKDFSGGLVTDNPSYALENNEFRAINGVFPRYRGSLRLRAGLHSGLVITSPIHGFTRFFDEAYPYIVYAIQNGTTGSIIAYNETTLGSTTLYTATYFQRTFEPIVQFGDRVLFFKGSVLYSWDGTTNSQVGVIPPPDDPFAVYTGTGELNTNNLLPVKYVYTYVDSNGIEGNPSSPSSSVQGGTGNFGVNLTLSEPTFTGSPTNIVQRNIYRIGGLLSQYTKVGEIAAPVTFPSVTVYNDTLGDGDVGTTIASFSHNAPPLGIENMVVAKNRLVASIGYTLYVSNLGIPDYFPDIVTFPESDGFQFDIDPDIKNPIVSLTTVGSSVLIGRYRNIYLLQGNDFDSWSLTKVCDIGVIARRSMVQCGNYSVWMAPDGMVYALGDNEVQPLALPIQVTLESVTKALLPFACACYFRRQYHLCIPNGVSTGHPLYLVYDFTVNKWFNMSQVYTNVTQMYSETGQTDLDEILMSTSSSGFTLPTGASFAGIVSEFSYLDNTTNIDIDVYSGDFDFGSPDWIKAFKSVRIRGKSVPKTATNVIVTLRSVFDKTDGSTTTTTKAYTLNSLASSGVLLDTSTITNLEGHRLSYEISGIATVFELDDIEVEYSMVRQGRF